MIGLVSLFHLLWPAEKNATRKWLVWTLWTPGGKSPSICTKKKKEKPLKLHQSWTAFTSVNNRHHFFCLCVFAAVGDTVWHNNSTNSSGVSKEKSGSFFTNIQFTSCWWWVCAMAFYQWAQLSFYHSNCIFYHRFSALWGGSHTFLLSAPKMSQAFLKCKTFSVSKQK